MGKLCSKCYKQKPKENPNVEKSNLENSLEQIKDNSPCRITINPAEIKIDFTSLKMTKEPEELKEPTIQKTNTNQKNWDGYFTNEQVSYYEKLYETELYDRVETKLITKFKKGELIGQGAFGKVYQGFEEQIGRVIAIKEIDLKKINSKNLQCVSSVELEIDILSKLYHKNIVKYYGVNKNEDHLDILLEFCIGGSLVKLLDTYKRFSESIIRKYTIQILEGLEYLHAHNIIHRDIKGANILVDRDGVCKLSDFGGAKMLVEEVNLQKNSFRGTPNWMAPETVKYLEYTRFSDIWSVGCTVIEMATGEPPWSEHKSPVKVLYTIYNTNEPPEIPKHLSFELKDFLSKCLKIDPKQRANVTQLLSHPFITGDLSVYGNIMNNQETENKNVSEDQNPRFSSLSKFKRGDKWSHNTTNKLIKKKKKPGRKRQKSKCRL